MYLACHLFQDHQSNVESGSILSSDAVKKVAQTGHRILLPPKPCPMDGVFPKNNFVLTIVPPPHFVLGSCKTHFVKLDFVINTAVNKLDQPVSYWMIWE